ncbi:MAG: SGNH/GDSL hydrolase family protein [Rhodoplanes sp.]
MSMAPRDKALADVRRKRFKTGLTNAALVLVSLAITYFVSEYLFFRHVLPHVAMDLRAHVPDRAEIYLQNAKAGYVPRDYIALIGDSHAQGAGDWLWSVGYKNDRPYHSANVIRDLAGKDVITLGRGGAGSAEALVLRVSRILGESECYLFPPIELPRRFFIYFYEGNDIYDNSRALRRALRAGGPDLTASLDRVLEHDYGAQWRCYGHLGGMIHSMASYLVVDTMTRFRAYMARLLVRSASAESRPTGLSAVSDEVAPATDNRVLIGGVAVRTPELQIPPANLTDRQLEDGIAVYERSLAWLRRHFPSVPVTVVYIPSPAASYRHAADEVLAKDFTHRFAPDTGGAGAEGPSFPVSRVFAYSQRLCRRIREVSLQQGAAFVDLRPAFRQAGARQALHGPTDWNHPNEAGYRLLGATVAKHLNDQPADRCDDAWPS